MGIRFSKKRATSGGTSGSVSTDPEIQQRNNSDLILNVQFPSTSPNGMNQNLIRITLETKKDKWNNSHMAELAKDYFDNTERTSDLLTVLKTSLEKAGKFQLMGDPAVKSFYQEEAVAVPVAANEEDQPLEATWKTRYPKTLDELSRFKAIGDPFTDEFYMGIRSVYQQQLSMIEKLDKTKMEQKRKLKFVKIWRKFTFITFVSAFVALLICSVVAALVAAHRIAAAMTAAGSYPLVFLGKWLDSKWKIYQGALTAEKELIDAMHAGTSAIHTDLDSTKILAKQLGDNIRSLLNDPEFVFENEDALRLSIEKLSKMIEEMKSIQGLVKQADKWSGNIWQARTAVFQLIDKLHK